MNKKNFLAFTILLASALLMLQSTSASAEEREIEVKGKYIRVPIHNGKRSSIAIKVGDVRVHNLGGHVATSPDEIHWWAHLEMDEYVGKKAKVTIIGDGAKTINLIDSSNERKDAKTLYKEDLRPRFHFSQKEGWSNDPNGMMYYDGEWHLFWQCNPAGKIHWANMYWGHAVSKDLLHWEELNHALRIDGGKDRENRHRSMANGSCYSGGGFVDINNTLGMQKGKDKTLLVTFTDTAIGESLAYSTDKGRTWTYPKSNPLIKHRGRDPKLFWYEPEKKWVIAVYDMNTKNKEGKNVHGIAFYESKDLKEWTRTGAAPDYFECPEIFELPVDGDKKKMKWVLLGADAKYAIGTFDGKTFKADEDKKRGGFPGVYAGQCFSNTPDGRVIYIGWCRALDIPAPAAFTQGFTLPVEFTLKTTKDGIRMFTNPVEEIAKLRGEKIANASNLKPGKAFSLESKDQEFDIVLTLKKHGKRGLVTVIIGDTEAVHVTGCDFYGDTGKVRVLVDRTTIEAFKDGGARYTLQSRGKQMGKPVGKIVIKPSNMTSIVKLEIFKMKSILPK